MDQRDEERQALLLAARKLLERLAGLAVEPDVRQPLVDLALAERYAVEPGEETNDLARGEVLLKARRLERDAIRDFALNGSRRASIPSIRIVPDRGVSSPSIALNVLVLPAPLGPSRPKISPRAISRLSSETATLAP